MFYCDDDAQRLDWPVTFLSRSRGTCEICGKIADCNDIPSKYLPTARRYATPATPPDLRCVTTPDGACTGAGPCMHTDGL